MSVDYKLYDLSEQNFVVLILFKCPIFETVDTVSFHYVYDEKTQNIRKIFDNRKRTLHVKVEHLPNT